MSENADIQGFAALSSLYPWPSSPRFPDVQPVGRKINGYGLVEEVIRSTGVLKPVVLEIGAEFGASTRRALAIPGVHVVSVDPWPDAYRFRSFPDLREKFLGIERAMYDLFQSFNFDYRDRLVAVREFSPYGVRVVYDAGVRPDVVYVDADHQFESVFEDLTVTSTLFPDAVITGDDWNYNLKMARLEGIELPVRTAVKRWAQVHDVAIVTRRNQWMIDRQRSYNMERVEPVFGGPAESWGILERRVRELEAQYKKLAKRQRQMVDARRRRGPVRALRRTWTSTRRGPNGR